MRTMASSLATFCGHQRLSPENFVSKCSFSAICYDWYKKKAFADKSLRHGAVNIQRNGN